MEEIKKVEEEKLVTGKLVIGLKGLKNPTPSWATTLFRVVFILTGVIIGVVLTDPGIAADTKVRLAIYLKGFDVVIWGLTRQFGIEVTRDFSSQPPAYNHTS